MSVLAKTWSIIHGILSFLRPLTHSWRHSHYVSSLPPALKTQTQLH